MDDVHALVVVEHEVDLQEAAAFAPVQHQPLFLLRPGSAALGRSARELIFLNLYAIGSLVCSQKQRDLLAGGMLMMVKLAPASAYISCVACLLTLGASGDDLNLARLLLPSAFRDVAPGALPLDDENTDFIAPTDSAASEHEAPAPIHPPAPAGWGLVISRPVLEGPDRSRGATLRGHPLPGPFSAPLRC